MSIQNALSIVMDLCENNLKENDYLTAANQLKFIYDQSNRRTIVGSRRILNDEELENIRRAAFVLTTNEKRTIMKQRLDRHYNSMSNIIRDEIEQVAEDMAEATQDKKDAWALVNVWRHSFGSPNKENALFDHRRCVQREKELRQKAKSLRQELSYLRNVL
jgi:hypothetical protein